MLLSPQMMLSYLQSQQQSQGGDDFICDGRKIDQVGARIANLPSELLLRISSTRHELQVSIVGILTSSIPNDVHDVRTVYDGTGTIEVRQFKDGVDENQVRRKHVSGAHDCINLCGCV